MAPGAIDAEEWLQAMRRLAVETIDGSRPQLPPLPDMTGATKNEKAVLLFMRGIGAAELGDMKTAETMVRYALKISPELSAPMCAWPSWAKDVTKRMIEAQLGAKAPQARVVAQEPPLTSAGGEEADQSKERAAGSWLDMLLPAFLAVCIALGIAGTVWIRYGRRFQRSMQMMPRMSQSTHASEVFRSTYQLCHVFRRLSSASFLKTS